MPKVVEVSDGRILTGEQAKAVKLVDELGGMSDAVEALAKEAGIAGKPNLVYASKKKRAIERLFRDFDDEETESRMGASSALSRGLEAVLRGMGAGGGSAGELLGPLFLMPHFTR
jgi:protease-4